MKINFNNISAKEVNNFKGGEKSILLKVFSDDLNKIMINKLLPGASIGLHKHDDSSEIIFILSGKGYFICDGVKESVEQGDCHYCPKGSEHTFINDSEEELEFFAIVPQQ